MSRLAIVGGTYYEICRDPDWNRLYGSGLRAVHALSERDCAITYYTYIGKHDLDDLQVILHSVKATLKANILFDTIEFFYDQPLSVPEYSSLIQHSYEPIYVEEDLVLQYGGYYAYSGQAAGK